jgi:hypothetical protein
MLMIWERLRIRSPFSPCENTSIDGRDMPRGRPPGIKETKPRRPRNGIVVPPRVKSIRQRPVGAERREQISCWLSKPLADQVRELAASRSKTRAGLLTDIVTEYLRGLGT